MRGCRHKDQVKWSKSWKDIMSCNSKKQERKTWNRRNELQAHKIHIDFYETHRKEPSLLLGKDNAHLARPLTNTCKHWQLQTKDCLDLHLGALVDLSTDLERRWNGLVHVCRRKSTKRFLDRNHEFWTFWAYCTRTASTDSDFWYVSCK